MRNILHKFLQSLNWSNIPIGPQATLIEQVKGLNHLVPSPLQSIRINPDVDREYWDKKGYKPVFFEITKRFTWSRNTSHKIRACIDYFHNLYPSKGLKIKGMHTLFDRREQARSYSYLRFKRTVIEIERALAEKRFVGEIWVDDDKEVKEIISQIQNNIVSSLGKLSDHLEIDSAYPNKKMEYVIPEYQVESERKLILNGILRKMWKDDTAQPVLFLDKGCKKTLNSNEEFSPGITIICQIPNVIVNAFRGDHGKVPIFKSNTGKVIFALEMNFEQLVRSAIGANTRNRPYIYRFRQKFWHKPPVLGVKHPFINYFMRRSDMIQTPIDEWPVAFGTTPNTCFGNIDMFKYAEKLDFILWAEEIYTWLTTFRIGTTHPLNQIQYTYLGHPINTDPKLGDYYLDAVGHNYTQCHERISNYYTILERRNICNANCKQSHRAKCGGYQDDKDRHDFALVDQIFNDDTELSRCIADSTFPLIDMYEEEYDEYHERYYYTVPAIPSEVIPYMVDDYNSLENDMIEWIRQNQNG